MSRLSRSRHVIAGILLLVLLSVLTGALAGAEAGALAVAPSAPAGFRVAAPANRPAPRVARTRRHLIVNLQGSVAPRRLGYNVFDTGPSLATVESLPRGVTAMVWLGQKCPTPADADFRATVRKLAGSRRVYGYYLSDEPHIDDCPGGPRALATRTRFIRRASQGRQKSLAVLSEVEDFGAFRPAVTGLDLVGLDPYPCSAAHPSCDLSKIETEVRAARARGIPLRRIVPVYQAFGQEHTGEPYYHLPTPDQLRRMLARWAAAVPNPPLDYTYGWGHQGSANPTLVDAPALQRVVAGFLAR